MLRSIVRTSLVCFALGMGLIASPGWSIEEEEPAVRADQGGSGVQQFAQGAVEGVGSGEALGELVERGEVGDPAGQPVLDEHSRRGRHAGQRTGSVR